MQIATADLSESMRRRAALQPLLCRDRAIQAGANGGEHTTQTYDVFFVTAARLGSARGDCWPRRAVAHRDDQTAPRNGHFVGSGTRPSRPGARRWKAWECKESHI